MKRSALITALALIVVLSGCGLWQRPPSSGDKKITLTLWYWNRSIDDELLKQVDQQFPNIHLNYQKIGGDFKAKLMTTLAARSGGPDIVGLNDWVSALFPDKTRFVNLYDLGAKEVQSKYLEWKWKQGVTPDGTMIAFPMDTGPTALFYREDLFRQAGLPTDPAEVNKQLRTWDAYFEAGKKLKQALGGKVSMTDNVKDLYGQVLAQGKDLYFTPDGQFIGERSEQVQKAWAAAAKAYKDGVVANVDRWTPEWNAAMNKGDIASFVGAVWMKKVLKDAAPDTSGKWRVARAPGGDGNNGGSFLAIMKTSQHPKEAFEVIKWLQSESNQLRAFQDLDLFPSAPGAFSDPKMNSEEPFFGGQKTGAIFAESAKNVQVAYFGEKFTLVDGIMKQEMDKVAKQNKSPDAAWQDAMKQIQRELKR
ncbi:ABC transporter substrate-binding protein [Paenibacillus hamazuiensis]|uniref:ABC transporter substrate-binding protein n=1 Tax=Paenibacillus hamazuiensis TaxID=2936508 RepID=UPI00200DE889|nr:extracellular solute-binding protein [Paenibacillus hamazuiensis]